MFYKDEPLALFIDGGALNAAARAFDVKIDYKKLLEEFSRRGHLIRAHFYNATTEFVGEDNDFHPVRPLLDWLDYNGFNVTRKTVREYPDSPRKPRASFSVDLTVDALRLAPHIRHAVIFTGDGDYVPLVNELKARGVRVSVVSTREVEPPMISDELRRTCDNFIDVKALAGVIGEPVDRSNTSAR